MAKRKRFKIPVIVEKVYFKEYAEAFGDDAFIEVWVNPPRAFLARSEVNRKDTADILETMGTLADKINQDQGDDKAKEALQVANTRLVDINHDVMSWWSTLLSKGSDPEEHWTPEMVAELIEETSDTDPGFWPWLRQTCYDRITDHRNAKKNGRRKH